MATFIKPIFIVIYLLTIFQSLIAQPYITDDQVGPEVMAKSDGDMRILYFTASWCGPCKMMAPVIETLQQEPDINFYKMDIDQNTMDGIMGVASVPTFIFIRDGKELGRAVGAMSEERLTKTIYDHKAITAGEPLRYKPVPSKYEIRGGAHPNLSKKTVESIWQDCDAMIKLALEIAQNLNDTQDLELAVLLTQRAIEIRDTAEPLVLRAIIFGQMGKIKEARQLLNETKPKATDEIKELIDQVLSDLPEEDK